MMDSRQSDAGEPPLVRVCDCGVVATGWAQAKCGRDRRHNISVACPTLVMRITAWEPADDDRTTAEREVE